MPKLVLFCHSLRSDWNHGNAHFLRGILAEWGRRGFSAAAWEPSDAWSARNLAAEHGETALDAWREAYPRSAASRFTTRRRSTSTRRSMVRIWSSSMNGARPIWSRASRPTAGPAGAICFCSTTRITGWRPIPRRSPASISTGSTACWLSARCCRRPIAAAAGDGRYSPGTRRPICSVFRPHPGNPARARSRLDRQLGRRRAHDGSVRVSDRAGQGSRPVGPGAWRALPSGGSSRARRRRHRLCRLSAEFPGAASLRRGANDGPCSAPTLCDGVARHPDNPRLRGARLRHPAGLRAVA